MVWLRRLVNVFRSDRVDRDAGREMAFHVAERVDELVAGGMSEAEARREARRRFGRHADIRARVHRIEVIGWLEAVVSDLRYAARALKANSGFTIVAVVSLGLGIGANTAIFSLIHALMLRPLPVDRPEEIVQVAMEDGSHGAGGGGPRGTTFTNPLWEGIRDRQDALAATLAFADQRFNLTAGGVVRRTGGAWVSGGYFEALGVPAVRGRVLAPADDLPGCPALAVLSHGYWQREYGGAEDVVGGTISLDGHPFRIIGVSAPGFSGIHVGRSAGIFVPLCSVRALRPGRDLLEARSTWFLNVFGRLAPGTTPSEARGALAATAPAVFRAAVPAHYSPEERREFAETSLTAEAAANGLSLVRGQYREALLTLLVVVGVVLLIACANVAQLLMARATSRQHEVAVRLALGSGRARLVRQLLTESVLLALLGAALGTLFAHWSSRLVVGLLAQAGRAVTLDLSLDLAVLGFTIAVATATGLLFGLAPAWRSARVAPGRAIRGSGRGLVGDPRQRFARSIVVGQVALSFVLVVAAGLLVGSFRRLATADPGFRADGVLIASVGWSDLELSEARGATFPRELVERVRTIPGVRHASASLLTPISGTTWNDDVAFHEGALESRSEWPVMFNGVTDGYLETLGTRLLAGRDFTPGDGAGAPPVVLVSRALARRYYGEASPVGRRLSTFVHDSVGPAMEIVGVVEDARYARVDEDIGPAAYVPLEQTEPWSPSTDLALRTDAAPGALIPAVTSAMREIHPAITLEFATLEDQVAVSLARPRLLATLSGFFGGLALLLAVIGLYGTMSYSVARRRNEMGIRIALGSARTGILRLVAGEAGGVIAAGVSLGVLLAIAGTRLIGSFLFGVTPTDPRTLALSALILAAVAMGAALGPAWRAAGVDPMVALREE